MTLLLSQNCWSLSHFEPFCLFLCKNWVATCLAISPGKFQYSPERKTRKWNKKESIKRTNIANCVSFLKKQNKYQLNFFERKGYQLKKIWWTLRLIYTFYTFIFFSADSFNVFLRMIVEAYSSFHSSYMWKTDAYLPLWWLVSVMQCCFEQKKRY